MIGPFSEEQIAHMQASAEKREPFRVEVQLKDKDGRKSKIRLEGKRIANFDIYYKDLWDEPYLIHVDEETDNGNAGHGYAERVSDFTTPSVSEWVKEYWERHKQFYDFEGAEEQMRWF